MEQITYNKIDFIREYLQIESQLKLIKSTKSLSQEKMIHYYNGQLGFILTKFRKAFDENFWDQKEYKNSEKYFIKISTGRIILK